MAMATSSRRPPLRGRHAVTILASVAAIAVAGATFALLGGSPGRAFPALVPAAAPAGWPQRALPNGTAVLSYPPSLRLVSGDADAVSAAQVSSAGAFQLYLNATPRQGDEQLRGWAAFRLRLLTADDAASARELAAAQDVAFRGGTGSCIIDQYVTRIGAHSYQEIACLVQGRAGASVIVAAAPAATWANASPLVLQAVAAYQVR
jgi:hypothetical protein